MVVNGEQDEDSGGPGVVGHFFGGGDKRVFLSLGNSPADVESVLDGYEGEYDVYQHGLQEQCDGGDRIDHGCAQGDDVLEVDKHG